MDPVAEEIDIKIVLVGDSSVGKTCIVKQATTGTFEPGTYTTLGAAYSSKFMKISNKEIHLQIWDTAGQERYRGMTPMYYRGAQAILLVFSLADKSSFERLDEWVNSINQSAESGSLIFLIANKTDLEDERAVDQSSGEQKAKQIGAFYHEVSAKTGMGIDDLFITLSKTVVEKANLNDPSKKGNVIDVATPLPTVNEKASKCC